MARRNNVPETVSHETRQAKALQRHRETEAIQRRAAKHPSMSVRNPGNVPLSAGVYREFMSGRGGQGDSDLHLGNAAKTALESAAFAGAGEIVASGVRAMGASARQAMDFGLRPVTAAGELEPLYSQVAVRSEPVTEAIATLSGRAGAAPSISVLPAVYRQGIGAGYEMFGDSTSAGRVAEIASNGGVRFYYGRTTVDPKISHTALTTSDNGTASSMEAARILRAARFSDEGATIQVPPMRDTNVRKVSKLYPDGFLTDEVSGAYKARVVSGKWRKTNTPVDWLNATARDYMDGLGWSNRHITSLDSQKFRDSLDRRLTARFIKGETFAEEHPGAFYNEAKPFRYVDPSEIRAVGISADIDNVARDHIIRLAKERGIPYQILSEDGAPGTMPETAFQESSAVPKVTRQDAKGGDTRADAKGGDSGTETTVSETSVSEAPAPQGGPRIVINPSTFHNEKDAACVMWNEAFRVVMEDLEFEPQSEPTDEQRRFFSDTAYADDELQLRRTILARICTFDTSVKDPTDEQLQEAVEFLETVMEIGAPQNEWEQKAVQRLRDVIAASVGRKRKEAGPQEPPEDEGTVRGDVGGGMTDEERNRPENMVDAEGARAIEVAMGVQSSYQQGDAQPLTESAQTAPSAQAQAQAQAQAPAEQAPVEQTSQPGQTTTGQPQPTAAQPGQTTTQPQPANGGDQFLYSWSSDGEVVFGNGGAGQAQEGGQRQPAEKSGRRIDSPMTKDIGPKAARPIEQSIVAPGAKGSILNSSNAARPITNSIVPAGAKGSILNSSNAAWPITQDIVPKDSPGSLSYKKKQETT